MPFCAKCGNQVSDDQKFCAKCGTPVGTAGAAPQQNAGAASQQNNGANSVNDFINNIGSTEDQTASFDQADINQNKAMAVLSYIGILVLVPILAAKQSRFAKFHANQGLILLILDAAAGIITGVLKAILKAIFPADFSWVTYTYTRGVAYNILSFVVSLIPLACCVLAIIGIVYAAQGKAKELPIIGKIKLLK